jgi:hemoglobin
MHAGEANGACVVSGLPSASDRRRALQEKAAWMGIDDGYISLLVRSFYARIRQHEVLGPIFQSAIGEDWEPHLLRMEDFWSSVAMNSGRYSGKPVPVHKDVGGIEPAHFEMWLELFRETLISTAPREETIPYFMERANRIARSLQLALFGLPNLPSR